MLGPEVEKLLVVAHPDDDVLFAGASLACSSGWHVVVATHAQDVRGTQFNRTMRLHFHNTVSSFKAFNEPDAYTAENAAALVGFRSQLARYLFNIGSLKAANALPNLRLVLTHSSYGEYGHLQHVALAHLVYAAFTSQETMQPLVYFDTFNYSTSAQLPKWLYEHKTHALRFYAETQPDAAAIFRYARSNNSSVLQPKSKRSRQILEHLRCYFVHEKIVG